MTPPTISSLVDGVAMHAGSRHANVNPSDVSDVLCEVILAQDETAKAAVDSAAFAFQSWSLSTPQERFDVLDRAGAEILARKDELGRLLAREEGKTLREGTMEAARAGAIFKFHAAQAVRMAGECIPSVRPGVEVLVSREPIGVVTVITPWNFPLAIPAWKIAPALAAGNCVVFKPAEAVPFCAWEIASILDRAGLPAGVLNLVLGRGRDVGGVITSDPQVAAVTFTGSAETADSVMAMAMPTRKRLQLEMGGKNPLVVCDDADLDLAVEIALEGAFGSTGQRCTASSRLVVMDGVHDAFVDSLVSRMRTWQVGDALMPETDMGPVVNESQLGQDERYLELAVAEGGHVVGGERLERAAKGHYLAPALVVDTQPNDTINREEVFGPVASVIRVATFEEAVAVANDTELALSAGIATRSLGRAMHFRRHSAAGMVMVNLPTAGVDYHVPFGGRRGSSYGPREQGTYAEDFFTSVKTAYLRP